ncbi:RagB/SusD family nutrient uptake outer membrane protein [Geofilum rhodophaeum]|uniref:RagB/SusD family nutrient uptake outer membrane protein n=1 Tax=Geofilum rhodophaeum TaxID=1965019 RepID=UPI000B5289C3|nr:RagB/SusD family nutrient uptake outer membrane protein [Geofilum rhodophaeum]
MKRYIGILFALMLGVSACQDDFFEPAPENHLQLENVYDNPIYAEGLLLNAYARLPFSSWDISDVATDNAVSNDNDNAYRRMATGQWSAENNPMNRWTGSRSAIQYLNSLLSVSDSVAWAIDALPRAMFNDRIKGEIYALRAVFLFDLLQAHGGWTESGDLLGVPIVLEPEDINSDFNQPRATFEACLQQIYADLDKAEDLLPLDYEMISSVEQIPEKYRSAGATIDDYNRTNGDYFRSRISARIVKGVRAKVALLAASPAYSEATTTTWEDVANFAGEVLSLNGGLGAMAADGWTWYTNTDEIDGLTSGMNPPEMLWRGNRAQNNDIEEAHFPPTLYGNGMVNPTQNLVDAFPMANGYPINDPLSGYDAAHPYEGRDPRLAAYVLLNGGVAGPSDAVINTAEDGGTNDGLNKVESSTRTGYYMRKLLRQDVNLDPSIDTEQYKYKAFIRYTELFLIYAEAANEVWGPRGSGAYGFSAYDVIKALRTRAGVGSSDSDPYLEQAADDKAIMRQLIKNERRLELCFEGFRFWDLRRWNEELNVAAEGMAIRNGSYNRIAVENRVYRDYMYYGPLPYSEVLKYDELIQNKGW